ncbi:glycosyltransferase family protein [Flaviflexus equikiangi]|uniref:Glycosyltransferase n=1 Tax=Flaviflexus equikiangi TaxID=2758573 RepID=A0ABS2TGU6_9ACTO|nr:glycosyltransferase [Flaviflexus equikiangi]MBM9433883.1 glycosyltransferase [Flaviflexus equikiangi]
MPHSTDPRVLHYHDCADVGLALVTESRRQGFDWDYLSAQDVIPIRPANPLASKLLTARTLVRNNRRVAAAEIVHAHYAMVVPILRSIYMPKRPYFLTLHGTDIRTHWANPAMRPTVQACIDDAIKVYYTNLDTRENAETARADAEYMPAFIDPSRLSPWSQQSNRIIFLSRWEDNKGASANIQLAAELARLLPHVTLEGLDWGRYAPQARAAGVRLLPRMSHGDYARWVASGTIGIGQANPMLGVSEFEAMATGLPVAVLGSRIPRPDDGSVPPTLEGTLSEVVEQIVLCLDDPAGYAAALNAKDWVLDHHLPGPYVEKLQAEYRSALSR